MLSYLENLCDDTVKAAAAVLKEELADALDQEAHIAKDEMQSDAPKSGTGARSRRLFGARYLWNLHR